MLESHQISQVQQLTITDAHAGQRVDNFLFTALRGVPKSRIYRMIRKGELRINKKRVDVAYRLILGDIVRVPPIRVAAEPYKPQPSQQLKQTLTDAILYEDEHLLIINKPAGMAVHGGSGISLGLIEALREIRPKASFLELVHRLDRETSGCVMIAKRRSMLVHLHECLQAGTIEKRYFALVLGQWRGGNSVEAPLRKFVLRSGERMVKVDPEGKFARTTFQTLELYTQATLLQAIPWTGRTHQIRVHCAFMGHPIVGDQKYGDPEGNRWAKALGYDRLFLHAHQLEIPLPYAPYKLTVTCPMPVAGQAFCQLLKTNKRKSYAGSG